MLFMQLNKSKCLNIDNISSSIEKLGLSQASLSKSLDVSRQTISNWLSGKKLPRPAALLKLANILNLTLNEIIIKADRSKEPIVAFRRKGRHKIDSEYFESAKDKGFLLEQLVSYLPYDNLSIPPTLKNPIIDYNYIHKSADNVRKDIGVSDEYVIRFEDLIGFFNKFHSVIIPVFWGNKKNHENALHIHLPSSLTTWVYLNLDSKIHDFKFWMCHELGHIKAPSLRDDEAEDFADLFAGALLVSKKLAKREYNYISQLDNSYLQIDRIKEIAEELIISPLTIYYEINRYAEYTENPKIDLEENQEIYKVNTYFCNQYKTVAEHIFGKLPPTPRQYISCAKKVFDSPFFDVLKEFLEEKKKSVGYVQEILNLSQPDAHTLYESI